ncbi:MAG TPA: hypothetical protein VIT45_04635 [Allosphingosinicella sp.]
MILALLLLAAPPAVGEEAPKQTPQPALLEAFRAFCLAGYDPAALEPAAVAAGFHSVSVRPTWNETGAWERDGLRVFSRSVGNGPQSPALCGVSANIARLGQDDALLDPVAGMAEFAFIEGNPGAPHSDWIIAGRKRFVRVSIDRSDPANVDVILTAQLWPQESGK